MTETVTINIPEPHYTLFNTTRSDLPEVVVVNGALLGFVHTEIFQWHLEVTIDAEFLAENGMPTPDESKILFELGDAIEEALVGYNAIFLARSTWNGFRQLSFRVHDPEVANNLLQRLIAVEPPLRQWDYRMESDQEWIQAGYLFKLFPLSSGANT
jgi:hypothetical protein